ncbi:Gfo/Idh/MocA family protein [Macrococcus brunensis]|uniref:Gfo/Idh/MocA family protein n=1 Tax=Macrococcus brunensis TaxID=198483 RepID=UPI001EEF9A51|nr:Gfo/Idh/MocA family oxidoreductase [Macrococcus brunensis]ULG72214.1 Gfo/Idh/MocA family oxidoreductase [Macrococcus brunensis]
MKESLNWAILGTGVIANELAQAFQADERTLYSVANRTYDKAVRFAEKYQIDKVYDSIEDVFTDPAVDVIYISTPHNTHIDYLRKALKNGKHVLCEKSITLNVEELSEAIELAEQHRVVLAEAMTIYHMPLYRNLSRIIESGKLGQLKMIQMNFGSYKEYDMNNRFFNPNLAGGALLDIGVYALSFVRWFMTSTPTQIDSQVKMAPSGVDEQVGILLTNNEGEMATVTLSLHAKQPKRGMIAFDKGYIEIYDYPRGERAVITYTEDGRQETVENGSTRSALQYEVKDMENAILNGETMYLDYTKDVMAIMARLREAWGLKYPEEK